MFSDDAHHRCAELRPSRLAQSPNGFLSFLHYEDVHAVLCDRNLRPVSLESLDFMGVTHGPLREMFERLMFSQEGADHQRLRRLVSSAFAPRSIEALRVPTRQNISELLDTIVHNGQGDLTEQLAKPLAITALCDLLGVPKEDIPRFQQWAAGMGLAFGAPNPETVPIIEAASVGLSEYAEVLIERRRTSPTADVVSALVQAEEDGDRLSTPELVATVANLLFAGYDTTYRQITLGLLCMARNEAVRGRLAGDASLAAGVAEEVLRLEPIAHSTVRLAVADSSVNGIDLPAGMMVEPWIAAANRDPSVFDDPDRFDPDRQGPRPLSFGQGIHSCLGAALARLELSEALAAAAERLVGWDFAIDPVSLDWYPLTEGFRGLARLPVHAA
jgi:cytochrome P450